MINNPSNSILDSLRNILLVILLLAIGISYHPLIINMSRMTGLESGTILSRYIILLFIGIFVLSLLSKGYTFVRSITIRSIIIWMLIIVVVAILVFAIFDNTKILGDIKDLTIVLCSIVIGWNLRATRNFLYILAFSFVVSVFYSGIMQVTINIGGFVIEDLYLTTAKNSLGALLASASLILLFIVYETRIPLLRIISIAGVMFGLFLLLIIRSRMAFFTCGLLIVYYFYLRLRNYNFIYVAGLLILAFIAVYLFMPSSIYDLFGASMTAGSQSEDITSGRLHTYIDALTILADDPLFANIHNTEQIGWVHNYPLLKLSNYGLLFSWPILVLYCYLLWKALSRSFRFNGIVSFFNLFLLVPYLISMAEPTFPFGPGTATVFNFILFGIADRVIVTNTSLMVEK